MSRRIVFKRPIPGGTPSIHCVFKGKHQVDYFTLRNVAEKDFQMRQTQLARMILSEWVSIYRHRQKTDGSHKRMVEQLKIRFGELPKGPAPEAE